MPCYNCVYVSTKNQIKKKEVEKMWQNSFVQTTHIPKNIPPAAKSLKLHKPP